MAELRGYRIGAWFFALVTLLCSAILPLAISCCSRFLPSRLPTGAAVDSDRLSPGIKPAAVALLDWPMDFRLFLMTLVAAVLCLFSTLASAFLTRASSRQGAWAAWAACARAVFACMTVGVLYILASYVAGFVGYRGPANLIWMAGIPVLIALTHAPRLAALLISFPLFIGGWVAMAVIGMTVGIPLD